VDDNVFNILVLETLLSTAFKLNAADRALNGQEAVDACLARSRPYDLIFMDLNMPIKDGLEASSEILQIFPDCHIIALTAYNTDVFKEKCYAIGMRGFLTKPVSEERLGQLLRERGFIQS
jgi:CheY-like chemotaxis protein